MCFHHVVLQYGVYRSIRKKINVLIYLRKTHIKMETAKHKL